MAGPDERWAVAIDPAVCIGSGICAATADRYFHLVGGYGEVRESPVAADPLVIDAAESCPVEAILVRHADSGEIVAPTP
ncbi:hypothetical protein Val02_72090 [Virgisporangium aliadipatigenens]|uniref:Ferredoxin n=1 Tax=Virgisporangium aliadipatigenens TaxID=741659 RepID=A0A8J4DUQ6_9ACTN|nr:ferredoxin [Virgisporangium aliadipatigenens]GIJ50323.1 hypothetical protein Val02_72090 [Virgisporangium aliadipatigenens]